MKLAPYLDVKRMTLDLNVDSREALFGSMVHLIKKSGVSLDEKDVVGALLKRESDSPTGIGHGLAIPHATIDGLDGTIISVARLANPMKFGGRRAEIIIMVLGPASGAQEHLGVLARIARIFSSGTFTEELCGAKSVGELRSLLVEEDERRVG